MRRRVWSSVVVGRRRRRPCYGSELSFVADTVGYYLICAVCVICTASGIHTWQIELEAQLSQTRTSVRGCHVMLKMRSFACGRAIKTKKLTVHTLTRMTCEHRSQDNYIELQAVAARWAATA